MITKYAPHPMKSTHIIKGNTGWAKSYKKKTFQHEEFKQFFSAKEVI